MQPDASAEPRGPEGPDLTDAPAIELQGMKPSPADETSSRDRARARRPSEYAAPDDWANLDELAATAPVENVDEQHIYRHRSLEETRAPESQRRKSIAALPTEGEAKPPQAEEEKAEVSPFATQLFTLSYLIFFAILGTLARVGLSALTRYPGAPVSFSVLWPNFGGSLVMGYLIEDRNLFFHGDGELGSIGQLEGQARSKRYDEENDPGSGLVEAKKMHMAVKKTFPLYVGLSTGFCGSLTSFSTFIADAFLAVSNDLVAPDGPNPPRGRNGGYSFMALLAVVIVTVSLSLAGLSLGAHLAIALEHRKVSIRYPVARKVLDPLGVLLGWGSWLGAVLMAIFPPHDVWRGRVVFALVFAPLGCLARFYLSLYLNGKMASFPLGTFVANVTGTAVLGMAFDIAHVPIGGVAGCQVLQGVQDGFCGCLTTVSTWVAELSSLRRRHAYVYGGVSVVSAFALMVAIMGGLRWSEGFGGLLCST
jgi:fluoride ion exporter CrcB/FEX